MTFMMPQFIHVWLGVAIIVIGSSLAVFAEEPSILSGEASIGEIKAIVEQMKVASSVEVRRTLSERLSDFCGRVDPAGFDADTIDTIAAFLKDSDDVVRFWTAAALGRIGPDARRAIPALEKALWARLNAPYDGSLLAPTLDSSDAMEFALQKIRRK